MSDPRTAAGRSSQAGTRVLVQVEEPGLAGALAAGVAAAATATATARRARRRRRATTRRAPRPTGPSPGTGSSTTTRHPEPGCLAALLRGADRNPGGSRAGPQDRRLVGSRPTGRRGQQVGPGNPGRRSAGTQRARPGPVRRGPARLRRRLRGHARARRRRGARSTGWTRRSATGPARPTCAGGSGPAARRSGSSPPRSWPIARRAIGGCGPPPGCATPGDRARAGQLILELSQAPAAALPWRYVRAWVSTAVRVDRPAAHA